jgi:hypothetical protein
MPSRNEPNVGHAISSSEAGTPTSVAISGAPAGGQGDAPQLPTTSVVEPIRSAESIHGSTSGTTSEWL